MLEGKEIDKLFQILNIGEQPLEFIEGQFLINYNEPFLIFKATYTLNTLINLNLISLQQRIIAIFLLTQNFKAEGFRKNPFNGTILSIYQTTPESFQKQMIYDLVIENNREKYAKTKIQALFDEEQLMLEKIENKPQMDKLREQIIAIMPKISQSKRSEVYNSVNDGFDHRGKKIGPPEAQISHLSLKAFENCSFTSNVGSLRPIPEFISVSSSQFNWLSPGIIADVHWDNAADIQKKFSKIRTFIKKGLQTKLQKQQVNEIERTLENQAYAVLNLDISVDNLNLLIKHNPFVAISFLNKMASYPIISQYLQSILDYQTSFNSIDVMFRLIKTIRIPEEFIEAYILKNMKEAMTFPENYKDRSKLVRIITYFIKALVKNKIIEIESYADDILQFTNHFNYIDQIKILRTLITVKQ